jgi:hypothetical protein
MERGGEGVRERMGMSVRPTLGLSERVERSSAGGGEELLLLLAKCFWKEGGNWGRGGRTEASRVAGW